MIELLISIVQVACLAGYLYGAWLAMSHSADVHGSRRAVRAERVSDDDVAWRRFLACDV